MPWGGELYVGGEDYNFGSWNGTRWLTRSGVNGRVRALTVFNGDLLLAGEFSEAGGTPTEAKTAKWDGVSMTVFGGTVLASTEKPLYMSAVAVHDNKVYVGGFDAPALWSSDGSPADWAVVGDGADDEVKALHSFENSLYAGGAFSTVGDTISSPRFAQYYDPTVVAAESPPASAIALHPNFPNPFNPSTSIRYEVPQGHGGGGLVRLEIFDARGRRVRTLVSRHEAPGPKTVRWNGKDNVGRDAALIGGGSISRKMVLVR
jgi:hypothetical protein